MRTRFEKKVRACLLLSTGACCTLWTFEVLFLWFTRREFFAGTEEFRMFALVALGVFIGAGVLAGGLEVLVSYLSEFIQFTLKKSAPRGLAKINHAALAYTIIASPWLVYTSRHVFQGEAITRKSVSAYGPYLMGSALLGISYFSIAFAAATIKNYKTGARPASRFGKLSPPFFLLALIVALFLIDATVLIDLYPYIHITLAATTFLAAQFLLALLYYQLRTPYGPKIRHIRRFVLPIVFAAFIGAGALVPGIFQKHQSLRSLAYQMSINEKKCLLAGNYLGSLFPQPGGRVLQESEPLVQSGMVAAEREDLPPSTYPADEHPPLFGKCKAMNVVLVVMDGLRADRLSCYGYERETSPYIDRLCQESVIFKNAYVQSQPQSFSMVTVFASAYPDQVNKIDGYIPSLPSILQRSGYVTGRATGTHQFLWDSNTLVLGFMVNGYEKYRTDPEVDTRKEHDKILAMGLQFIREYRDRAFFLWVQPKYTHEPWSVPGQYKVFGDSLADRYDSCARYGDDGVQEFVEALRDMALLDKTILIITADHGESLKEHGAIGHGTNLYNENIHIPLIMRIPGIQPRVVEENVGHADILPTLLALLGIKRDMEMLGSDLGPLLLGETRLQRKFLPVYSPGQRRWAILQDRWKLIFSERTKTYELYDLENDPAEKANLVDEKPDIAAESKEALHLGREWRKRDLMRLAIQDRSIDQLLSAAEQSASAEERLMGINMLVRKNAAEAVPLLRAILTDEEDDLTIRRATVRALGDLRAEESVDELAKLLDPRCSKDRILSRWSIGALEKIGTREAARKLFEYLPEARSEHVRIIHIVARIGDWATVENYLRDNACSANERTLNYALSTLAGMKDGGTESSYNVYRLRDWRAASAPPGSETEKLRAIEEAEAKNWMIIQPAYLQDNRDGYYEVTLGKMPMDQQPGGHYYASTWVYAPTSREIHLLCGSEKSVQISLNGTPILKEMICRPFKLGRSCTAHLEKGWNWILVRVERAGKRDPFYLTLFDRAETDSGERTPPLAISSTRKKLP